MLDQSLCFFGKGNAKKGEKSGSPKRRLERRERERNVKDNKCICGERASKRWGERDERRGEDDFAVNIFTSPDLIPIVKCSMDQSVSVILSFRPMCCKGPPPSQHLHLHDVQGVSLIHRLWIEKDNMSPVPCTNKTNKPNHQMTIIKKKKLSVL